MLAVLICNIEIILQEKKLAIASSYWWFLIGSNNPFFQAPPLKSVCKSGY